MTLKRDSKGIRKGDEYDGRETVLWSWTVALPRKNAPRCRREAQGEGDKREQWKWRRRWWWWWKGRVKPSLSPAFLTWSVRLHGRSCRVKRRSRWRLARGECRRRKQLRHSKGRGGAWSEYQQGRQRLLATFWWPPRGQGLGQNTREERRGRLRRFRERGNNDLRHG